jgi:hypothetical protein
LSSLANVLGDVKLVKKKNFVFEGLMLIVIFMLVFTQMSAVFAAAILEDVSTWYWTADTYIKSVARGDVDIDGQEEIVTVGNYFDGTRQVAQLCTWDGSTLASEDFTSWYWTDHTKINSVAVADVDGDTQLEIVTGGNYYDGTRYNAQLCVWSVFALFGIRGLRLEAVTTWYWTSHTHIYSIAVGDVDADTQMEIVTAGTYNDGTQDFAQLCVWDGTTLAIEDVTTWYWISSACINSVAVGDVDDDNQMEIVTGGYYWDGPQIAQLCVWDGATLTLEGVTSWYWTGDTHINSVAVGDVDGDTKIEIVTGGEYQDNNLAVAQLCVWDGATLALEDVTTWYWTDNTYINSVAVGDVDADGQMEMVTGGYYLDWDEGSYVTQLFIWDASPLILKDVTTWVWTSSTVIESVVVGDVDGDTNLEIVTGGYFHDGNHPNAQLCTWDYS